MDLKARDKCLKEVRVLQNLDHPNIIRYLESFIDGNDLYIVFEWAAAGDLKRQLRKAQEKGTPFSERIVWKYFAQICDAMQHMHERRIMHRDLKVSSLPTVEDLCGVNTFLDRKTIVRVSCVCVILNVAAAGEYFSHHGRHNQSRRPWAEQRDERRDDASIFEGRHAIVHVARGA